MKRIVILFILTFLFLGIQSVKLYPERVTTINEVDISLVDSSLSQVQQGIYEFTTTIENIGDPATTGTVPISWEEYVYAMPLTNGIGTLDESVADYDINGDGDEDDTFTVEWNNTIRPWDAEINGAYVYALADHSVDRMFNRSYYIDGQSKLFQLGNKMHTLYFADNDVASFGLGDAVILNHPSPNFELVVYSNVSFIDIKINGVNAEVNLSVTGVETFADGTDHTYSICVVPNQAAIETNEQIEFSCTIIAHETTACEVALLANWSPDGVIRYRWVPFYQADASFEAINRPYFITIESDLITVNAYTKQITSTVKNIGAPATTGNVPISWEDIMYDLPLDDGEGTLDESVVDSDLNGDGDKDDTFDVRWDPSADRPWDAMVDGIHVYALRELPFESVNRTYYLDGNSKLFKLGSETHTLYAASNDLASFGIGNAFIETHPCPNFAVIVLANVSASNFKINGMVVEADHMYSGIQVWADGSIQNITGYYVPKQASKINTGEEVTFSGIFSSYETTTCDVYLMLNWSPDGNIRYFVNPLIETDVSLEATPTPMPTSTTSTSTSSTTTETEPTKSNGTPGFSFIICLLIVLPVLHTWKKKNT
ncbi:MAG: hypothetical protein ACFFC6_16615 [Promethearchaeota archaeon]